MRAVVIREPGGPDVLDVETREDPKPGAGEVRIRVKAAGVNRPDCVQRLGRYAPPPGVTDVPGLEVAGVVDAVGEAVLDLRAGDEVMALVAGGGYAELCLAPAAQCMPRPHTLSWAEAAAIPETHLTVWANVFEAGQLRAGEILLVHGGTSGIGSTAIRLAKLAGSFVVVTCGSDEKCAWARELGADLAIDYQAQDFVEALASQPLTANGVDVVLDMVGGDYVGRNLHALRSGGRHVSIAFLRGPQAEIDIVRVMKKQLVLTGSTLRARPIEEKRRLIQALTRRFGGALDDGQLAPQISHRFPLTEAAAAHRVMEAGLHRGKIVLLP